MTYSIINDQVFVLLPSAIVFIPLTIMGGNELLQQTNKPKYRVVITLWQIVTCYSLTVITIVSFAWILASKKH